MRLAFSGVRTMDSSSASRPLRGFGVPAIVLWLMIMEVGHGARRWGDAESAIPVLTNTRRDFGALECLGNYNFLQSKPAQHLASELFPFFLLLLCGATLTLVLWCSRRMTRRERMRQEDKGPSAMPEESELLAIFVREVPAAVAMFDRDMRYLQASDRWCERLGIKREESIGRSHYEIFPDTPARWRAIHQRCLEGESDLCEDDLWEKVDGPAMWVRWEIRPWGLKEGRPRGVLAYMDDITERRRMERALRESEATTRTLLDTASQAIVAVNSEGRIVMANRMAEMMFGYTKEELAGSSVEDLMPVRFREGHRSYRSAFLENLKARSMGLGMDLVGLRRNGEEFPIEVSLSAVPAETGMLAVSFVSDITVRKLAERKLRESESTLHQLAGSLLSAQEEERRNLARELHDDITQRLAFLSMELGRVPGILPEPAQAHVRTLREQIRRLSAEVHRLSRGLHPSVIADFGLSAALEEFCEEFRRARGITVEFEMPGEEPHIDPASATCLFRVAQESMSNAADHGHTSKIFISLTEKEGCVTLRVRDEGVGFSIHSLSSKRGLGLISMQERIRHVKGTLSLSSEPGKGALVTASVPVSGGRHEAPQASNRG